MTLGQSIKSIRKHLGETLVQFAARLGTDNSVVSRYENDRVVPSRSMLLLIAPYAETPAEKSALAKALGSNTELDKQSHEFLSSADDLLAQLKVDNLTRDRFRSIVERLISSGDIDRSVVKFLELFARNTGEASRKYIEDWVWSLDHRLADLSAKVDLPKAELSADPHEEEFLKRARDFYRAASTEEVHEVESLMVSTRPATIKQRRKIADVG